MTRAPEKLLHRFRDDQTGSYVIATALLMPVMIGFAGLGTDVALWQAQHRLIQDAADSSAISAATAFSKGTTGNLTVEAEAVAARYALVNGTNGVTVTVNRPPIAGAYSGVVNAVEVIVSEPQPRFFSALWSSEPVLVSSRAVALADEGSGCVLALNPTASGAATTQGGAAVSLTGCSLYDNSANPTALTAGGSSSITARSVGVVGGISGESNISTTHGTHSGIAPVRDPYANVSHSSFSGCSHNNFGAHSTTTINPGVYCNGMRINAGATVTFNPGVYYIDRGTFRVNGGATLNGNGVTLVFTSSTGNNWADAVINGGATVNLTPPDSGPTAGIVVFGDRNMAAGTEFIFNGGSSQYFGGAVYLPRGHVDFSGGASTSTSCTQLIANTIEFSGNANFALNCDDTGTAPIIITARLVE